jgi:hypothetical protein
MKRWYGVAVLGVAIGVAVVVGCRHRMTERECSLVLDRIVELELAERGFRDPELARRRQSEVRARLASELSGCTGRRAAGNVEACLAKAKSAEEISHVCLR